MTLEIMMPFYGSFDYFRLAVESVLAQTDPDWHLTILDDVNPDPAPGEWARSIDDARVTYLRNEVNLRPSRNYNKSVGIATAEFIQIMGCDDIMLPGFVSRIHALIAQFPDADVIQPGVSVIDSDGAASRPLADRVKGWYRHPGQGARTLSGENLAISLLRGNWTYFPSLVWRRKNLMSGFRIDLDVVQDLAMLLDIATSGGTLVVDDIEVFKYRRHRTSVSAVTGFDGSKFIQESTLFAEAERAARERGWLKASRVASRHLSSRFNAATELPGAIFSKNASGRRTLARHILGIGQTSARTAISPEE